MTLTTLKQKACTVCAKLYTVERMGQDVCGYRCARKVPVLARKAERQDTKQRKEKLVTKPELVKKAQFAFNAFIRARDSGKPCICCGKPLQVGGVGGGFDAGHYRSVGSAPHLRFDETNCHGQTKHCNNYLAGNHVAYRQGLIERIGLRELELLEADQCLRKYTKEGLVEIARHYNAEARRLKAAV